MRTATPEKYIYILVDLFKIFIKSSCHAISHKEGAGQWNERKLIKKWERPGHARLVKLKPRGHVDHSMDK